MINKPIIRNDVQKPMFVCGCGWVSHDPRYTLKYHAKVHGCKKANGNER